MTLYEHMAVAAIKRWWQERLRTRTGQAVSYKRQGWTERRCRSFDARLVRCIDFERVLSGLAGEQQVLLLLKYRDNMPIQEIALVVEMPTSTVLYQLRNARWALYDALDRHNLL
jgi:DNA-directed RNA polymerase specialized sigma24 family protein